MHDNPSPIKQAVPGNSRVSIYIEDSRKAGKASHNRIISFNKTPDTNAANPYFHNAGRLSNSFSRKK